MIIHLPYLDVDLGDPFTQGVLTGFVVFLGIEAVFTVIQVAAWSWRRHHVPRHRIRGWWERAVGDRLWGLVNQPPASHRRVFYAHRAQDRFERRVEHFRRRLHAHYPSLDSPPPTEPPGADSDPVPAPQLGEPQLLRYDPREYEVPLRCPTVGTCDDRLLIAGEKFWAIPTNADTGAPFLVVCASCALIPAGVPF